MPIVNAISNKHLFERVCYYTQPLLLPLAQQQCIQFLNALPELIFNENQPAADTAQPATEAKSLRDINEMLDIIATLRALRPNVEANIRPLLVQHIQQFAQLVKSPQQQIAPSDIQSWTIVSVDAMEINVALDLYGAKLATALEPVLSDAFLRLQAGGGGALVNANQLPFHPRLMLQVTLESFTPLDLNSRQQQGIIRLFAETIDLKTLKPIIEQIVVEAQVPALDKTIRPQPSSTPPARPEKKSTDRLIQKNEGDDKQDLSAVLRDLKAFNLQQRQRQANPNAPRANAVYQGDPNRPMTTAVATGAAGGVIVEPDMLGGLASQFGQLSQGVAQVSLSPKPVNALATEQILPTQRVTDLLTRLQALESRATPDNQQAQPSVAQVRDTIRGQLRNDEAYLERINQKDSGLMDLVSTLFDFILDDEELPSAMKVLLGRLQLPMLKVALLDPAFFRSDTHPARRLLNQLARAGIGWDAQSKNNDVLYSRIEQVVFSILNEFNDDVRLFERLLKDFEVFFAEQDKRVSIIEERTRLAEESRARAEAARALVQQTLTEKLTNREVPLPMVRLLFEGWRHVLYMASVKEGVESAYWQQSLKVIDALLWSCNPLPDTVWVERLTQLQPRLVNSLRKGLAAVNFDAVHTEQLLHAVLALHQALMAGQPVPRAQLVTTEPDQTDPQYPVFTLEDALKHAELPGQAFIILPTQAAIEADTLPANDRCVVTARQLSIGRWVEFKQETQVDRHKLVARIRSSEKMIFANRRGIKVAELTEMQFARALSQKQARIIEDQIEVIDRAMHRVVGGLRQLADAD